MHSSRVSAASGVWSRSVCRFLPIHLRDNNIDIVAYTHTHTHISLHKERERERDARRVGRVVCCLCQSVIISRGRHFHHTVRTVGRSAKGTVGKVGKESHTTSHRSVQLMIGTGLSAGSDHGSHKGSSGSDGSGNNQPQTSRTRR